MLECATKFYFIINLRSSMLDKQNTIQPDRQDMLEEQFEHITYLINNDKINNAIELLLDLHYADLADFIDNASRKHYHVILPNIADKIAKKYDFP